MHATIHKYSINFFRNAVNTLKFIYPVGPTLQGTSNPDSYLHNLYRGTKISVSNLFRGEKEIPWRVE